MRRLVIVIACFAFCACLQAQGVTLLYKHNLGWYDPLSWVQINVPAGETPIQRVPTADDDVVISSSMSGITWIEFGTDDTNPDFNIGGSSPNGAARCRSMHISNTTISIDNSSLADRAPVVNVYTSHGGFVIIDSSANMRHGIFHLHGGNPKITDLQILHSTYGILFSHAIWSGITWNSGARLRTLGSKLAGYRFTGEPGGNVLIDSSTIETNYLKFGDSSTITLLNSKITNNGNNNYLEFFIGRNSNFVSANDTVLTFNTLKFTTSGLQFNGDVGGWGEGGGLIEFLQADPANPLPNIINGNFTARLLGKFAISGDLKISGNFYGYTHEMINNPIAVVVNNQEVFTMGGIYNYGSSAFIDDCVQDFCHFKLEFFGSTNSNITWNGGFSIDTLIINKTNCAKVTCDSSLYVSGATRIQGGQLRLDPDDNITYKFVCAGNVDIAAGAGLFLQKDSNGKVANMAVAGVITDHNPTPDSLCVGVSNPYKGLITYYRNSPLPLTLLNFYGKYYNNSIALGWSTEREINTKHFIVEKSADQLLFHPIATIHSSANGPGKKEYRFTDDTSLKPMNFYRLKMVDADGRFTYSKIVAIAVPVSNSISLFPNPVNDRLLITTAKFATVTEVIIADAKGTHIKRIQLPAGTTNAYVNTADLPAGVYSISFLSKHGKYTRQFIKL